MKACRVRANRLNQYSVLVFLILASQASLAQISTDGSVGAIQSFTGENVEIGESLGGRAGDNLFHSFEQFNINTGQSVLFTGSNDIANVISRVTGGESSLIDGLLQSDIGNADFFFFNPSGIVFGDNARIDVPASLYISTADNLRFNDGEAFSADALGQSSLSFSAPSAFGFLGGSESQIAINGSTQTFDQSQTVHISAGEIRLQDARIENPGGTLSLATTGDLASELAFGSGPDLQASQQGSITIADSLLDVSGEQAGSISLSTGNLHMENGELSADNRGDLDADIGHGIHIRAETMLHSGTGLIAATADAAGAGGTIDIELSGKLDVLAGGQIGTTAAEQGNAGDVQISAGSLLVENQEAERLSAIFSQSLVGATGNSGNVQINGGEEIRVLNGAQILNLTFSAGHTGNLELAADQIVLAGQDENFSAAIINSARPGSGGNAGAIEIVATDEVSILDDAFISSATFSTGNSGDVSINTGNLTVRGGSSFTEEGFRSFTGIESSTALDSSGTGGNISIEASGQISLLNNGLIRSNANSTGDAGNINIRATKLLIDQQDGLFTGLNSDGAFQSTGNGGDMAIDIAEQLTILNGADISSDAFGDGNAGDITVNARNLLMDSDDFGSEIRSSVIITEAAGNGGVITIDVEEQLTLLNSSKISSSTAGVGDAGNIVINAGEILIDERDGIGTGLSSDSDFTAAGHGGNIDINVGNKLSILGGADISSDSQKLGNGGNISINAKDILIEGDLTSISSESSILSVGDAGNITINVEDHLDVKAGGNISSTTAGEGNAGNVSITARSTTLDNLGGLITSIESNSRGSGNAGNVNVVVEDMLSVINGAQITSDITREGNGGAVSVSAGELLISGNLTSISSEVSTLGTGMGGNVDVAVDGLLQVLNDASISTETTGDGNAGNIHVTAGSLFLDGNFSSLTGISSSSILGAVGNAGDIEIEVDGQLTAINSATISSDARAEGNAGNVSVTAGSVFLDGGDGFFQQASVAKQ